MPAPARNLLQILGMAGATAFVVALVLGRYDVAAGVFVWAGLVIVYLRWGARLEAFGESLSVRERLDRRARAATRAERATARRDLERRARRSRKDRR